MPPLHEHQGTNIPSQGPSGCFQNPKCPLYNLRRSWPFLSVSSCVFGQWPLDHYTRALVCTSLAYKSIFKIVQHSPTYLRGALRFFRRLVRPRASILLSNYCLKVKFEPYKWKKGRRAPTWFERQGKWLTVALAPNNARFTSKAQTLHCYKSLHKWNGKWYFYPILLL